MSISWFIFIGAVLALALLSLTLKEDKNFINKSKSNFRWIYLAFLVALGGLAIGTINKYLFPKDNTVFSNVDYHVLQHKGFAFDSVQYLVRSDFPEEALWDGKTGSIILMHDTITLQNYYEPFFIEKKDGNNHYFDLVNIIVDDNISQGFTLGQNGKTIYSLEILPFKENNLEKCYYISHLADGKSDTSCFTKPINLGYPLSDIISCTPNFNFTEYLQQIFEGTLLVRESIEIEDDNKFGREKSEKNESALKLVPGKSFFAESNLKVNGKDLTAYNPSKRFVITLSGEQLFYSGIGRTKTDIFRIKPEGKNSVHLHYVLPKMQKLRMQDGQLFITSSVDDAVDAKMDGGYFYNIFENEDNFSHINGRLRYFVGSARDSMYFETMDLYAQNPTEKRIVNADSEFLLQAKMSGNNNLRWVFNVTNLRETNSLKWEHFCIFIIVFIFLVGMRLLIDVAANTRSLSVLELAVYVVVFCFSIIRLILGWRMSTFVPLEDISATVFTKMRNGNSVWFWTCSAWSLPVLFTLISFRKNSINHIENTKKSRNKNRFKFISRIPIWGIGSLLVIIFSCYALLSRIDLLTRIVNIPVPIITYLLFDLWLIKRQNESDSTFKKHLSRLFLWIICFCYLFIQDAGFSIIFLLYSLIHFGIVATLLKTGKKSNEFELKYFYRNKFVKVIALCVIFFCFLKWEGNLLIFTFENVGLVVFVGSFISAVLIIYWCKKKYIDIGLGRLLGFCCAVVGVIGVLEMNGILHEVSDFVNEKTHIKFRAEIQKLKENEAIDDLMIRSEFNTTDVTYILRSAHNQWFINQYNNDSIADSKYFNLQPHSNQGSSFPTQTTDLVVTRYVLAEHGPSVLFLLMLMLLILVGVYCHEAKLTILSNFALLSVFILLFSIALFVFLSATNRIVFFGQDFPFLSITSKIAVLFPLGLFAVAVVKMILDRNNKLTDDEIVEENKLLLPVTICVLTFSCILGISKQGKGQNENQFDVSKIITEIVDKAESIDHEFRRFQDKLQNTSSLSSDSIWKLYVNQVNDDDNSEYYRLSHDSAKENRFFRSLLKYFSEKTNDKVNPNELLHLRKRNGVYCLSVNRKHYFIPSAMQRDIQWTGQLLAAKTDKYFGFSKIKSRKDKKPLASEPDYDLNIIPADLHRQVSNISIMRLDTSWVDDKRPLLLIISKQSKGSKQYYHIEGDSLTIRGSSSENQLAARILPNDLVFLNIIVDEQEKTLVKWKYGKDNENFLAKNLWLNGRRQLFYPLGKESMWSYHFANLVSKKYGPNPQYRDSTIRISIDYDLHKKLYEIIDAENKSKLNLSESTIQQLVEFKILEFERQKNKDNKLKFYYNATSGQIEYEKELNAELLKSIAKINLQLKRLLPKKEAYKAIEEAIDNITERQFDYSAVVIDGNGRIRVLFDYSKTRKIDPNNIKYLNRFLSNFYKESNIASESDIFGNKTLQLLNPGPGSSFKPIAYTAITSQHDFKWNSLGVSQAFLKDVQLSDNPKKIRYYGGVNCDVDKEQYWSLDVTSGGFNYNDYLIHSNNLYHSVIVMLGNQRKGKQLEIMEQAGSGPLAFPVITYNGTRYSFKEWYNQGNMELHQGILTLGLNANFNLVEDIVRGSNMYSNYFGQEPHLSLLFNPKSGGWIYPETGSQNTSDRNLPPFIRNGLIQMSLGSSPLEVSPLQMTTMAMRLATLNRAKNITTLSDDATQIPEYTFFETSDWDSTTYFKFYQKQVLNQLRQVPITGTARTLKDHPAYMKSTKGYYIYAKTGTLNIDNKSDERLKHLLVIISKEPLEGAATTIKDLKKVKYYALYLSYIGIDKDDFFTGNYGKIISEVIDSELFEKYMNSNNE